MTFVLHFVINTFSQLFIHEDNSRNASELETSRDSIDSQDEYYFPRRQQQLSSSFSWWEEMKSEFDGKEEEKQEKDFVNFSTSKLEENNRTTES